MGFSAEKLLAHSFPEIRQRYDRRDAILYALGVGLGADPLDPVDLAFLDDTASHVLPTYATTLASPGMWVRDPALGIDWVKLVHARQKATFFEVLPESGEVIAQARVVSVIDLGKERGAEALVERSILDAASDRILCRLEQTLLLRGNGGFSDKTTERPPRWNPPAREPDVSIAFATSPRSALIYRLSGDWNPLHISPDTAARAGFPRPILHGLASYGLSGWVILKALAGGLPARLETLAVRFAGVVTPGDRLDFLLWRDGEVVTFLARVGDRIVLDQGEARLRI